MKAGRWRVFMAVYNPIDYDARVQRAAEALADLFEVTVLSLDSGGGYLSDRYRSWVVAVPTFRRFKGLSHLYFWLRVVWAALRVRPDVVYAHDVYVAFPGWVAARLTRAKLVYDAHELVVPEEGVPLSRRDLVFYRLERWAVRRATLVIAANGERARIMQLHHGLREPPLVIRNIAPVPGEVFGPEGVLRHYPALRRRDPGRVRLVYQGDMSLIRNLDVFVSALGRLDDRFELVLVGGGGDLPKLQAQVQAEGLSERVIFLGRVPRSHLHDVLRTCDIGIITYPEKGLNYVYCEPNKLYEYAHAGLPVIATCQPSLRRVIDEYRIGMVVACDGPSSHERMEIQVVAAIEEVAKRSGEYQARIVEFLRDYRWEVERQRLQAAVATWDSNRGSGSSGA